MSDSTKIRITRGEPNELGWVNLEPSDGELLIGNSPSKDAKPLLSFIHISDLHICDAQSPARVELMDRFADPHNPTSEMIPLVGAYRAQEIMTTQTLETMVRTINSISTGKHSERPIDFVIATGDVTDNAQANELEWYLTIMDGGLVHPDSGDNEHWEGVASTDPKTYDRSYWNPEGTPDGCEDDFPRSLYGFPTIPGLTSAVRQPFMATGVRHKWLATHGNHDALLQGTVPPDELLTNIATGGERLTELAPDIDLVKVFSGWSMVGPASYADPKGGKFRSQDVDERRRLNQTSDWARLHLSCNHDGHGLTQTNIENGTKYWFKDIGDFRIISLDTVNINGGWQGSLDESQFNWLKRILKETTQKYIILASHHPLHTMFNLFAPEGADRRIGIDEITDELLKHPKIKLWVAGHDHDNRIRYVGTEGENGFWHILTSSLIDWPQQGRMIEIFEDEQELVICTLVFDHQSPINLEEATSNLLEAKNLAGISRILSANHWQRRKNNEYFNELAAGEPTDRNRYLRLKI